MLLWSGFCFLRSAVNKKIFIVLGVIGLLLATGSFLLIRTGLAQTQQQLFTHVRALMPNNRTNLSASVTPSTNSAAAVTAAAVTAVTVDGIVISGRPSATLGFKGRKFTVMVGDQLELPFTSGAEWVRCEKIEGQSVWLLFMRNQASAELKISPK